jgi:adenosyl cobinamide kinase/adenosyl cobinamide phosphate guanylyltransferase
MIDLILGGARSGKSALALQCAQAHAGPVIWFATAQAGDAEMAARIARHRAERPAHWSTVEEPLHLAQTLRQAATDESCCVVDCLTLWLSNLMLTKGSALLEPEQRALLDCLPNLPGSVVLVANEVGLGIVPDNALARRFRDLAGWLNQAVSARADRVCFVAAGLPLWLNGAP